MKKKGKERARKEARKAGKEQLLEKPANNSARRKARKVEREKAVAQASEDLKLSALLSRRRKRSAIRILKKEELEEEQKVVTKAKKDLKSVDNTMSRNQTRAAKKLIAQAEERKKIRRAEGRAQREAARLSLRTSLVKKAQEETEVHPKKKLKQERHKLELELGQAARIDEQRWLKFNAERQKAEEIAAQRIRILEEAVSKHTRGKDMKRLQQSKAWKTKTIITRKRNVEQAKVKEDSFAMAGITGATDSSLLGVLLRQQQTLIELAQKGKRGRNTEVEEERGVNEHERSEPSGSVRVLSKKLNSDLWQADGSNSKSGTGADMWSTPFKQSVGKEARGRGEPGAQSTGYQPSRQPMKLEALSTYKQADKLDAMQWFKAAKVRLKKSSKFGFFIFRRGGHRGYYG